MKKILLITIGIILLNIVTISVANAKCGNESDCENGEYCDTTDSKDIKCYKNCINCSGGGQCIKGVCKQFDLKDYKFNVKDNLSLDKTQQEQAYFGNENPVIALIMRVINFALRVMGAIAVIILIIGGFMMMVAQGDQTKLGEAKDLVKYAAIGLLLAFLSYIIVIFVQSLFVSKESDIQPAAELQITFHNPKISQNILNL